MRPVHVMLSAALILAPLPAAAQPMASACAAVDDSRLPPALAAWTQRAPLAAADSAAKLGDAPLPIGKGVDAELIRNGEVAFPVLPGKPGGSVSYGGLYELRISEAGDYQVSLGSGAWIEVMDDQGLVDSTAHAPGPACSSLRKTVVFPLKPGRHVLAITGNSDPQLALMVTRLAP